MAASERSGIPALSGLIRLGANGRDKTRRLTSELLQLSNRPTAIIASDSVIALEVFKMIREANLSLPEDISLITFHDADWTSVTTPPITVIDQPVYRLGEQVAKLLVARLKGSLEPPRHLIVPAALVERHSVADRSAPSGEAKSGS